MGTIGKRGANWRFQVQRKGWRPVYGSARTRRDAEARMRAVESAMDRHQYVDLREAANTTIHEALARYENEVVPRKAHPAQEIQRLRWLQRQPFAQTSLTTLSVAQLSAYRDARLGAGISPATLRLEFALLSHLYSVARREWGYGSLANPIALVHKPPVAPGRTRRISPDELQRLLTAAGSSRTPRLAAFIELAIETCLRRGALLALRWEWVNLAARHVCVPPALRSHLNKSVPARLPLTQRAVELLAAHRRDNGPVFALTDHALSSAWRRLCRRAQLRDLRFHDLRHEGISRLAERQLSVAEIMAVTGHRTTSMALRYCHADFHRLLRKLDADGASGGSMSSGAS